MSHEGTNWAIKQRGLKPASKLVLWHLADRHNPDLGCFPSQERLADDCEMSRSALNEHLKLLEKRGLIRRVKSIDPKTRRQKNTRYILAFEEDGSPDDVSDGEIETADEGDEPCPESGHGAVSGKQPKPCPDFGQSRVRNPDTNPVREPLREPKARANGQGDQKIPSDAECEAFRRAYPAAGLLSVAPAQLPMMLARPVLRHGGIDRLTEAARSYAEAIHAADSKPLSLSNWLNNRELIEHYAAGQSSEVDWAGEVQLFALDGTWRPEGPKPGEFGCAAPADVLARFGYGKDAA